MALVGWTLLVVLLIPYRRFRAGAAGRVRTSDFRLGESANVPPEVSLPNRNFMNLLEMPLLFYVVCLTAHVAQAVDGVAVALAWLYVGLRMLHTVVHVTYNNVMHRLGFYAASAAVLAAMWVRLLGALLRY